MATVQYPFIDIAVHPRVRERFSRGEALVLFSPDLQRVLWANGSGAKLFGHDYIYDLLEDGPDKGSVTFRQMRATSGQLAHPGDQRSFLMRMANGFQSMTVRAHMELMADRAGNSVVLFAVPDQDKTLPAETCAAMMIDGFDDPDTHMAVLGADGSVVSASPGFEALDLAPLTARTLISAVSSRQDHLLKRPVPTGLGYLPAAIGKVSVIPALYLLFCVETAIGQMDPTDDFAFPETPEPARTGPDIPVDDIASRSESHVRAEALPAPRSADGSSSTYDTALDALSEIEEHADFTGTESDGVCEQDAAFEIADPAAVDGVGVDGPERNSPGSQAEISASSPDALLQAFDASAEPASDQNIPEMKLQEEMNLPLVQDGAASVDPSETVAAHEAINDPAAAILEGRTEPFVFNKNARPVRFVWKIDADGKFCDVSSEFALAVGPQAADVNDVAFEDIADRFKLDPDGKIAALLQRRDTWSGKTIYWPVENTAYRVPVDLAALPTYSRDRSFDGFRGFGIVRLADVVVDAEATGMHLATVKKSGAAPEETLPALEHSHEDPDTLTSVAIRTDFVNAQTLPASQSEDVETAQINADAGITYGVLSSDTGDASVENTVPPDFHGEPPALVLSETAGRRDSDKIISLDGRRNRESEGLTANEHAAFREIARRLDPFGLHNSADSATTGASLEPEQSSPVTKAPGAWSPGALANSEFEDDDDFEIDTSGPALAPEPLPAVDLAQIGIPARTKDAEGLSRHVVDSLPVALLVHNGETLLHANPEFLQATGYSSLEELEDAGGLDALLEHDDSGTKTGGTPGMMLATADGRLVPVTVRLQSVRWDDTNALILALATGVTSSKTVIEGVREKDLPSQSDAIAALRIEVDELRSILETATDGVVIVGQDGDIRSMNRSACALFNFDESDTRGKSFSMLFAHESQKAVMDYLAGLSGHGVASVLNDGREVIGREATGGFLPLFMTMGRLSSSNGFCAVIRDITQWKRTEEELRTAKRAAETANAHKSDFLARVSHEIRTPLNAIIGFSDMMATERLGPIGHPRYVEYSNDIGRSGRHVLDIVNDLLDISKIEAGEMELEFEAVELNESVSEAVSLLQPQANNQRVIIRTSLSQSVPKVVADLRSIKQIAINILANAIRYTPSGGQIVVSTAYEPNGSVVLRIRDTGIGMTRAELEQAMKPFRQVTTGSRKRGDGTGLGLPLTKAMVDANRANFAITSTPNEGTLVEISFPSQRVLAD